MKCDHTCVECGAREQGAWVDAIAARFVARKLCHRCDGWFPDMLAAEINKHGRPRNDEEFCAMVARFSIRLESGPWTDARIMDIAAGLAEGGFGPAFAAADYGQRSAWIDMCERALRSELGSARQVRTGGN